MEEQFININGLKTFTRIAGQGDPFLILHGWGRGLISWVDIQDKLSKHFKVIALDLPGFGKSDMPQKAWSVQDYANFILDFTKQLGISQFYLLGHSFGGSIAIKLAAEEPEKIKKLILVDSAAKRPGQNFIKKTLKTISNLSKPFSFLPGYQFARRIFYRFILRKTDYLQVKGIMKETFKKVVAEDLSFLWQKITIPTLIIWGKNDKITPLSDAYSMQKAIKNSELKILSCGHNVHREKPEELINLILEFIKR